MKEAVHFGKALGTYSPAIKVTAGETLYVSGQIPMNPETGELVTESFEAQARQSLTNLQAVLNKAGYTLDQLVRVTVFLSDLENFTKLNEVFKEFLHEPYPSRSTVQVARLPKDVAVEIDGIAVK